MNIFTLRFSFKTILLAEFIESPQYFFISLTLNYYSIDRRFKLPTILSWNASAKSFIHFVNHFSGFVAPNLNEIVIRIIYCVIRMLMKMIKKKAIICCLFSM